MISAILTIGKRLAVAGKFPCPLMYEWHESLYLGAAHGVAGVMHMLLYLSSYLSTSELQELVKPTVDYLATLRCVTLRQIQNVHQIFLLDFPVEITLLQLEEMSIARCNGVTALRVLCFCSPWRSR